MLAQAKLGSAPEPSVYMKADREPKLRLPLLDSRLARSQSVWCGSLSIWESTFAGVDFLDLDLAAAFEHWYDQCKYNPKNQQRHNQQHDWFEQTYKQVEPTKSDFFQRVSDLG